MKKKMDYSDIKLMQIIAKKQQEMKIVVDYQDMNLSYFIDSTNMKVHTLSIYGYEGVLEDLYQLKYLKILKIKNFEKLPNLSKMSKKLQELKIYKCKDSVLNINHINLKDIYISHSNIFEIIVKDKVKLEILFVSDSNLKYLKVKKNSLNQLNKLILIRNPIKYLDLKNLRSLKKMDLNDNYFEGTKLKNAQSMDSIMVW
ncbi:MAG: hypothetical protein EAY69_07385 [Cytophagales bacterium]|nr:MAG: hypothetical protein EAY69_07385 [Cytophagales bacterium]